MVSGTPNDDVICALGGDDRVNAVAGNDRLIGGNGSDSLHGGDGSTTPSRETAAPTSCGAMTATTT